MCIIYYNCIYMCVHVLYIIIVYSLSSQILTLKLSNYELPQPASSQDTSTISRAHSNNSNISNIHTNPPHPGHTNNTSYSSHMNNLMGYVNISPVASSTSESPMSTSGIHNNNTNNTSDINRGSSRRSNGKVSLTMESIHE